MMKKQVNAPSPTEAEMARPSVSGLSLENLEDRVEALRHASAPTRAARARINRASREAQMAKRKAANAEAAADAEAGSTKKP